MAKKHASARAAQPPSSKPVAPPSRWPVFAALAAALVVVLWAYGPALHGPFLFDDQTLPFALPGFADPLIDWLRGDRPVLMFTYWLNAQMSGSDPYSYHVFNVAIHCVTSALVFLIVRRFLEWSGALAPQRDLLAAFSGLLFLLHPTQSEAVAYLAGRSEALSVMLAFAALAVFIYRRQTRVDWRTALAVLVLFAASLLTKQQTIALPALLLLTDFWWNPGFSFQGIRANWKLYAPLLLGAAAGVAFFWRLITTATTAGFGLKDLTWYQYFFTECRALFVYIREFVFPYGLNADWDFPISKTILDRGAVFGLIALLALAAAAWHYRRRYPLAAFGFFAFLIMMAPTSSILPIRDPVAERRLYFGILGLILVAAGLLSRVKLPRATLAGACGAVLLIFAVATHARAEAWSNAVSLWQDTTEKSPEKARDHFQLASAYADAGQCGQAAAEYEKTSHFPPADYRLTDLLVDWGLALECAGQPQRALDKLRTAASIEPTAHVYTQIAKVYGDHSQWSEALDALAEAQKIDANYPSIYAYKGIIDYQTNRFAEAIAEYRHALALDPTLEPARQGLAAAQRRLAAGR
ncbi:MAG: tetratricopeptide repeat protein [Bryobacteraceae bacterium]|jgi:tetratricopeptide (TPR) repeat protein